MKKLLYCSLCLLVVGCSSFVKDANKSLYTASQLGDGAMKDYAIYWKWQTNHFGVTTNLLTQRQQVSLVSFKVGSSLNVASRALQDYKTNVGTNQAPKAVVQALIQTAVQDAGSLPGEIAIITEDPSWATVATH